MKRGEHGETIYVNRFYTIRNGELDTKHIFAGEVRVLSKLVKTPPTVDDGTEPLDIPGSRDLKECHLLCQLRGNNNFSKRLFLRKRGVLTRLSKINIMYLNNGAG